MKKKIGIEEPVYKEKVFPWELVVGEECCFHKGNRVAIVQDCVCEFDGCSEEDKEYSQVTVAEVWGVCGDSNQDIKEGRIMAASKELLAACKKVLEVVKANGRIDDIDVEGIEKAVKKAT